MDALSNCLKFLSRGYCLSTRSKMRRVRAAFFASAITPLLRYPEEKDGVARLARGVDAAQNLESLPGITATKCTCELSALIRCADALSLLSQRSREVRPRGTLFVLCMIVMFATACKGERSSKNVCPIDGAPPEWTGKRNGSSCEYLHYNAVERQTHSWWAECDLATPKKAN